MEEKSKGNRRRYDNTESARIIRRILDLAQLENAKQAAAKTDFGATSIREWLVGKVSPQLAGVIEFATQLEIPLSEVFKEE